MNLKEIKEMINLMNENGLSELEIEKEGLKIRIKKSPGGADSDSFRLDPTSYQVEAKALPKTAEPALDQFSSAKTNLQIVSPMVGTFYRAPSPEVAPFVDVGQVVEVGQVVCIVEAMKLMNEIKSEIRGRIIQCAVENAEPVEFGQTLFVVEPV